MCICKIKLWTELAKDLFTCLGIIGAGVWAVYIFMRQRENQPKIEMRAEIIFHKRVGEWWIVELITLIENKGKVQHKLYNLEFDLNSLNTGDQVNLAEQYGNQALFPHSIARGSFLRADMAFFFIEPGVTGKYSFLTRIPATAEAVVLHSWFDYKDINRAHGTEITAVVPTIEI